MNSCENLQHVQGTVKAIWTKHRRNCAIGRLKFTGLAKAIDDFRNICSQSKEIQAADLDNTRLKRGRKPSTPTQERSGKRRPTVPTEFTTRHFDTIHTYIHTSIHKLY